jgi:hypothetical protein
MIGIGERLGDLWLVGEECRELVDSFGRGSVVETRESCESLGGKLDDGK